MKKTEADSAPKYRATGLWSEKSRSSGKVYLRGGKGDSAFRVFKNDNKFGPKSPDYTIKKGDARITGMWIKEDGSISGRNQDTGDVWLLQKLEEAREGGPTHELFTTCKEYAPAEEEGQSGGVTDQDVKDVFEVF